MEITAIQVLGGRSFRSEAYADWREREKALYDMSSETFWEVSDLIMLPAGHLCVQRLADVECVANRVHGELSNHLGAPLIVFGIDVDPTARKAPNGLHAFVVAVGGRQKRPVLLKQISATAAEAPLAPGSTLPFGKQQRFLNVAGAKMAVCICGEAWSEQIRGAIAEAKPNVVIHLAHQGIKTGAGPRSWDKPLRKLARASRAPVVIAEHTRSPWRRRVWNAGGRVPKPTWVAPRTRRVAIYPLAIRIAT
jgi:hypothetical protein